MGSLSRPAIQLIFRLFESEVRTEFPLDEFPEPLDLACALVGSLLPLALDRLPWFGFREVLGTGPRGRMSLTAGASFCSRVLPFVVIVCPQRPLG